MDLFLARTANFPSQSVYFLILKMLYNAKTFSNRNTLL